MHPLCCLFHADLMLCLAICPPRATASCSNRDSAGRHIHEWRDERRGTLRADRRCAMRSALAALLLGVTSVLAAGCDNGGSSTSTPSSPSTPLVTENFTGTVDPGSLSANPFT